MAVLVKNGVPYEVRIQANDLASGKEISNLLYYKYYNPLNPYGQDVPLTDVLTIATSVETGWDGAIIPLVNPNYSGIQIVVRSIIGHRYPSPLRTITNSFIAGGIAFVTTATPHGFSSGQSVQITGSTTFPGLNGYWTNISVTSAVQFNFATGAAGGPGANGNVQQVRENQEFIYGDQVVHPYASVGTAAGEAMPLFCAASCRRLNTGVGRNWRSRCSISILNEPDGKNGRFLPAVLATWQAAWAGFVASQVGAGAQVLDPQAVSRYLAFAADSPFTESNTWTRPVTSGKVQPNYGSMTRRKPRLTSAIV